MTTETHPTNIFPSSPENFQRLLETLSGRPLFAITPPVEGESAFFGSLLIASYETWRVTNGVELDFSGDIQYLLTNSNVRKQLAANLFQHGTPGISQLNTTFELLVLASYSRHLTVKRTPKS